MNDDKKIEIGKRLEVIRINVLKVSKRDFAKLINIAEQNVWRLVKGKVGLSMDKLITLHEVFGLSTDYILFGEGNIKGKNNVKEIIVGALADYEGEELDIAMKVVKNILTKIN